MYFLLLSKFWVGFSNGVCCLYTIAFVNFGFTVLKKSNPKDTNETGGADLQSTAEKHVNANGKYVLGLTLCAILPISLWAAGYHPMPCRSGGREGVWPRRRNVWLTGSGSARSSFQKQGCSFLSPRRTTAKAYGSGDQTQNHQKSLIPTVKGPLAALSPI